MLSSFVQKRIYVIVTVAAALALAATTLSMTTQTAEATTVRNCHESNNEEFCTSGGGFGPQPFCTPREIECAGGFGARSSLDEEGNFESTGGFGHGGDETRSEFSGGCGGHTDNKHGPQC